MLKQTILPELQHEGAQTRKMLERIPYEAFDWKPHDKSMKLGRLAVHITELPNYIPLMLETSELDFAAWNHPPETVGSTAELLALHDRTLARAIEALSGASDELLLSNWTIRRGGQVIRSMPRLAIIRSMVLNHIVHHRAQLAVYLRMIDVPIPGMYGPSADERPPLA